MKKQKKQILKRGYVTHCLYNYDGTFYNVPGQIITDWEIERHSDIYWSEIYCEPGHLSILIRKGMLLRNMSDEELTRLQKQSIINCN